jgi:hypothetical protein
MGDRIAAQCPNCGLTGEVPFAVAGKTIRCKRCNLSFVVPKLGRAPAPATTPTPGPAAARAGAPAPAAKPAPSILDDIPDEVPLAPISEEEQRWAEEREKAKLVAHQRAEAERERL